jgi:hypothetical protein
MVEYLSISVHVEETQDGLVVFLTHLPPQVVFKLLCRQLAAAVAIKHPEGALQVGICNYFAQRGRGGQEFFIIGNVQE